MPVENARYKLAHMILIVILLLACPIIYTGIMWFLQSEFENGTINRLLVYIFSQQFFITFPIILFVTSVLIYIAFIRNKYIFTIGIILQILVILAAILVTLVISPRIKIVGTIPHEDAMYSFGIASPNGNYQLNLFECRGQECDVCRLIHTDSDTIRNALVQATSQADVFIVQVFTSVQTIERHVNIQHSDNLCQNR